MRCVVNLLSVFGSWDWMYWALWAVGMRWGLRWPWLSMSSLILLWGIHPFRERQPRGSPGQEELWPWLKQCPSWLWSPALYGWCTTTLWHSFPTGHQVLGKARKWNFPLFSWGVSFVLPDFCVFINFAMCFYKWIVVQYFCFSFMLHLLSCSFESRYWFALIKSQFPLFRAKCLLWDAVKGKSDTCTNILH